MWTLLLRSSVVCASSISWLTFSIFTDTNLSGDLREGFESSPVSSANWKLDSRAIHLHLSVSVTSGIGGEVGKVIEFEERFLPITKGNGWTSLNKVSSQRLQSSFREFLAAGLACMLVSIAGIVQLGPSFEVSED